VVIDLGLPYTGGEIQLEAGGRVRIPFATGESARRAAGDVTVSVRCDRPLVTGAVLGETPAIGPAPEPA
jgi:hypothetical protein